MKKAQLQTKLDQTKSQYASVLQDMQEHQARLNERQQQLKSLSEQYTQAVNKTPMPVALGPQEDPELPIPMAVETFVTSLGLTLTEEQRSQLHGLLKRPGQDADEASKRRKTESTPGFQGLQAPAPLAEFESAPTPNSVCRAASRTAPAGKQQMTYCAREQTQHHLQNLFQATLTTGEPSTKSAGEYTLVQEDSQSPPLENLFDTLESDSVQVDFQGNRSKQEYPCRALLLPPQNASCRTSP